MAQSASPRTESGIGYEAAGPFKKAELQSYYEHTPGFRRRDPFNNRRPASLADRLARNAKCSGGNSQH